MFEHQWRPREDQFMKKELEPNLRGSREYVGNPRRGDKPNGGHARAIREESARKNYSQVAGVVGDPSEPESVISEFRAEYWGDEADVTGDGASAVSDDDPVYGEG